jgi:hypothetical protein
MATLGIDTPSPATPSGGFPKDRGKEVKKSLKKLVKLDLIMQYPSTGEVHISLNPRLIFEVREIIGED